MDRRRRDVADGDHYMIGSHLMGIETSRATLEMLTGAHVQRIGAGVRPSTPSVCLLKCMTIYLRAHALNIGI